MRKWINFKQALNNVGEAVRTCYPALLRVLKRTALSNF